MSSITLIDYSDTVVLYCALCLTNLSSGAILNYLKLGVLSGKSRDIIRKNSHMYR